MTRRLGHYRLTVGSACLLATFPLLVGLSRGLGLLLMAHLLGGAIWAVISGASINRLLELIPEQARPGHLALYNLVLNVATLSGVMAGSLLGGWLGLREVLLGAVILRLASSLALARWG